MKRGVTVRFAADVIQTVKRFAAEDGVTVSTWIRRLIDKELRNPRPVDFRAYPQTKTTASGVPVSIEWSTPPTTATR